MDFNAWLIQVTGDFDTWMYTYILLILLVCVGIYFSIRTRFVQIRYIGDMFRQVTEKKHVEGERSISSFQALMVSTASRVGTGNIAGVATAVATGGPGAVFWMWAMAIFAFAYSSLIGNYFYAESNFKFITQSKPALIVFRVACLAAILYGVVNSGFACRRMLARR